MIRQCPSVTVRGLPRLLLARITAATACADYRDYSARSPRCADYRDYRTRPLPRLSCVTRTLAITTACADCRGCHGCVRGLPRIVITRIARWMTVASFCQVGSSWLFLSTSSTMSDALKRFLVRASACKATLSTLSGASLIRASANQRDAFLGQFPGLRFSAEEVAQATDALVAAHLTEPDLEAVMNALSERRVGHTRRRPNQDYMAWSAYLTNAEWNSFMACETPRIAAGFVVGLIVTKLGCVNPTEHTKKDICCMILARRLESIHAVHDICIDLKAAIKAFVNARFVSVRRRASPPTYVEKLPATPEMCKAELPEFYSTIAGVEGFVACPIDCSIVSVLETTLDCRMLPTPKAARAVTPQALAGQMDPARMMQSMMMALVQGLANNGNNCFAAARPGPVVRRLDTIAIDENPAAIGLQMSEARQQLQLCDSAAVQTRVQPPSSIEPSGSPAQPSGASPVTESSIAKATAVAIEALPSDVTAVAKVTVADDVENSDTGISKGAADSLPAPSCEKTPDNKIKVAHSLQLLERPS